MLGDWGATPSSPAKVLLESRESPIEMETAPEGEGEPAGDKDTSTTGERDNPALTSALSGRYSTAQLQDPTLVTALRNIRGVKGADQQPEAPLSYPHFTVKKGLLYRVTRSHNETLEQLLVPRTFCRAVLDLAHTHLLGAHLGIDKTQQRVVQSFFWPWVFKDVENFCCSCPECQLTAPRPSYPSPLLRRPLRESVWI